MHNIHEQPQKHIMEITWVNIWQWHYNYVTVIFKIKTWKRICRTSKILLNVFHYATNVTIIGVNNWQTALALISKYQFNKRLCTCIWNWTSINALICLIMISRLTYTVVSWLLRHFWHNHVRKERCKYLVCFGLISMLETHHESSRVTCISF